MWEKKRGQALVEFVIILPVFLILLLGFMDIGKILLTQNKLESEMDNVIESYKSSWNTESVLDTLKLKEEKIDLTTKEESNGYLEFKLTKEVEILTPGLNLIFKSPYKVETKRVIAYE